MADISKLEEQANLLMNNVSGWETNDTDKGRLIQSVNE